MYLKIKNNEVELQFGFKFLNELNRQFVTEQGGMKIDAGLMNAQVVFKTLDPIGIVKIIKSALSHLKVRPTDETVFEAMSEAVETNYEGDFEKFVNEIYNEMGKQPIIKANLNRLEKRMDEAQEQEEA